MSMHILGAGAIGLLHASHLRHLAPRVPITLLLRDSAHLDRFNAAGRRVTCHVDFSAPSSTRHVGDVAAERVDDDGRAGEKIDVLLVTTRAQDTLSALAPLVSARRVDAGTVVVLLQNGALGVAEAVVRAGMPWLRHAVRWADRLRAPGFGGDPGCGEEEPPRVVLGSCTHGVTRVAPFVIRHVGLGFTALGDPFEGCRTEEGRRVLRERLWDHIGEGPDGRCAKDTANGCVIECFSARDGGLERFKRSLLLKLVVNAGLNPLTALSGGRNGQVVDSPHGRALVASACEEIAQILEKELGMSGEAMAKAVEDVAMRTRGNRNSMEVDVTAGRETEVDFILGYLIDMASDSSATARLGMLRDLIKLRVECQR